MTITPGDDVGELLARTDVVIAATTSAEPVLPDDPALLAGKHFISVGSYRPAMQELPDAVYRLAGHLVLDSDFARHEVGDAINPVEKGILAPTEVFCNRSTCAWPALRRCEANHGLQVGRDGALRPVRREGAIRARKGTERRGGHRYLIGVAFRAGFSPAMRIDVRGGRL